MSLNNIRHSSGNDSLLLSSRKFLGKDLAAAEVKGKAPRKRAQRACQRCRIRRVRCDVMICGVPCVNCRFYGIDCEMVAQKLVAKKADRACQRCRIRRVRCDVIESGAPCMNCRFYAKDCVMLPEKRIVQRRSNSEELFSRSLRDADVDHLLNMSDFDSRSLISNPRSSCTDMASPQLVMARGYEYDENSPLGLGTYRVQPPIEFKPSSKDCLGDTPSQMPEEWSQTAEDLLSDLYNVNSVPNKNEASFLRPKTNECYSSTLSYIPQHLDKDDIEYLLKKGAFEVPEITLRRKLLKSFVENVFPFTPAVDIYPDIVNIFTADTTTGRINLMLLQALLMASSTFVDEDALRSTGFASRIEAQTIFYQRAKCLYDVGYEIDHVVIVQFLLYMTYAPTTICTKGGRHWLDMAIGFAYKAGLHKDSENRHVSSTRKSLLKRIWCSCLMKDQITALENKANVRITKENYDIPMLDLADFNHETFSCCASTISLPELDMNIQPNLAKLCVANAELCDYIGYVVTTRYSILSEIRGNNTQSYNTIEIVKEPMPIEEGAIDFVEDCDSGFSQWPRSNLFEFHSKSMVSKNTSLWTISQRATLRLIYLAAVIALHEYPVSTKANEQGISWCRVQEASTEVANIMLKLHSLGLIKVLQPFVVTLISPIVIGNITNLMSKGESVIQFTKERAFRLTKVVEELADTRPVAGKVFSVINLSYLHRIRLE